MLDRGPAAAAGGRRQDGRGPARPAGCGQGLPADAVLVVEPDASRRRDCSRDAAWRPRRWRGPTSLPATSPPGALLLAVKPQMMDAALPAYAGLVAADTLVLSIAAGKPIALFERALGAGLGVVRAMPNTPAAVGRGVTVLCANAAVGAAQRALAERLMAAVGRRALGRRTRSRCTRSPLFPAAARPMSSI